MRINLPDSETEYVLQEGDILVTKTDREGVITYCNKAFSEVSGYSESEILGQSHNILRHPDMPQQIFNEMWAVTNAGNSWHGILKNRRKNGDYYWVNINVSPLLENGKLIGFSSLRYKPTAEQIAETKKHIISVQEGKEQSLPRITDNYVASLERRLINKIVELEGYRDNVEEEQRIAAGYMEKLIAADKLSDPAVQFYLMPAKNFSGDLIAIARTPDNRLHLMLADSTGHGLSAALAAMPMIHPFYSMTSKGFTITAIAGEINKKVWDSLPVSHFVAAIIVSIDGMSGMVEVWSGGCPPPFILNKKGECAYQFKPSHLAMGILPPEEFDASVEYYSYKEEGVSLVMFSDGVTELENINGEQFGMERLQNIVCVEDPKVRWEQVIRKIENYCGEKAIHNDDITLMMVECEFGGKLTKRNFNIEQHAQGEIAGSVVWQFLLTLTIHQLRNLDVVPILLDIVQQIEKDKDQSSEIFMVLSEMFNNALDHGVLKMDSSLKHHKDGMEKYFDERAERLAHTETGHIQLNLEKVLNTTGRAFLRIRVIDSGEGFNYQQLDDRADTDEINMNRHGRGIALLYQVCRTVQFLKGGSEVFVEFDLESRNKSA